MVNKFIDIVDYLKKYVSLVQLLCAFFLTNTVLLVGFNQQNTSVSFFSSGYTQNINLAFAAIYFVIIAIVLGVMFRFLPTCERQKPLVLLASGWLYFFTTIVLIGAEIRLITAFLAVIAILIYYAVYSKDGSGDLPGISTLSLKIILIVLFAGLAGFIGVVTVSRCLALVAPAFDFGIFAQMFEYMRNTGLPNTTVERGALLSHFAVHISPAYYIILPVYIIFPYPATLQIMQALIVASAIFPLYKLCRLKKIPNIATLFVLTTFAFYPALSGGNMYDIHENMFLAAFVMWLLYFVESVLLHETPKIGWKHTICMYIFALLTFSVKEDAPIYVAVIALYIMFAKADDNHERAHYVKKIIHGIILFVMSVAYLFFALWLLDSFGEGLMLSSRHDVYTGDSGILGVIMTIITNPAFILNQIMNEMRVQYLLQMFLPLAFLPLISAKKRFAGLILFIPFILKNLMPTWPYQHDIGFQYHFGVTAIFFYLFVVNFTELKSAKMKKLILIFSATASIFMFTQFMWPRHEIVNTYRNNRDDVAAIHEVLDTIPDDVSIAATTFLVQPLSHVSELYEVNVNHGQNTDFVVIDLRWGGGLELCATFEERGYSSYMRREGLVAVYWRG